MSQLIFNDREAYLFNLGKHPEWRDITRELKEIYLNTLQNFSVEIIGQNYFNRNDIKHKSTSGGGKLAQVSVQEQPKLFSNRSDFLQILMGRLTNLFSQESLLLKETEQQIEQLRQENARQKAEINELHH